MSQGDIITQVPSPGLDEHGDFAAVAELPETINLNMRGTKFEVKRERLLTLPESILFSLSTGMNVQPFYESNDDESESDIMNVDFDPECFQYILDTLDENSSEVVPVPISTFRVSKGAHGDLDNTSEAGHAESVHDESGGDNESMESFQWLPTATNEIPLVLQSRPTLVVLREDLEYYVLRDPNLPTEDDIEVKELVGEALSNGTNEKFVFNGLRNARVLDSPEYHLMQMLVLSGLDPQQQWHYRKRTEFTSHMLSLEISRIKLPASSNTIEAIYSLQKLLLFWRKPAKKCWWDRFEMMVGPAQHSLDGKPEKVTVHVRRVWTLELSIVGLEE